MRKFGNGTKEETLYDTAGRITVKLQKNERNELLWAEGYVYGDDGKRTATVDNKGLVTLYEYNKKGQIQNVYYPYSQEIINNLRKEAEENGLPTNTDISENKYLPADIKSGLSSLLNSMQYGLAYSLPNMQIFVKESYSYDKNGNRTGKTTKYGIKRNEKEKAPTLKTSKAYIVFMSDSPYGCLDHTGILRKSEDGKINFTHNSSKNSTGGVSTRVFDNETDFQEWYDYNSFYYEELKTK